MTHVLDRIADRSAKVVVLGQGYVGLVVAMRASEAGFDVLGLEVDQARAKRLAAGDSYIEDVPDDVLRAALDRGYRPTADPADLAGFDVGVISVPTPLHDGLPDLSHIESAAQMLADHVTAGALVVLESTTYPGTTEELVGPILEQGSGLAVGSDVLLGYSPERIDPGNPTWGLHNTPKIVAGVDEPSADAVEAFFATFVEQTVRAPGTGVGGHCLPIDPTYLSWRVKQHLGEHFRFIELANDINAHMPAYVVRRVQELLNRDRKAVNGSRIVILGLSYKPNVGDWRESPALPMIEQLVSMGADVVAVDPHVEDVILPAGVALARTTAEAGLDGADLALVVADHAAFDLDEVLRTAPRVLDTRNRIAGEHPHLERL